jgi:WD40 repeat protein
MRSLKYVSLAITLVACGSKVDLGDAKSHSERGADPDGGAGAGGATQTAMGAGGASAGNAPERDGGAVDHFGGPPTPAPQCASISTASGHFNACGRAWSLAYSPDGQTLATTTGDFDPNVHIWKLSDGSLSHDLAGIGRAAYAVTFSPDGGLLAVGGLSDVGVGSRGTDMVKIYDTRTGAEQRVLQVDTGFFADAVAFSNDGTLLATGGYMGHVEVWQVADGTRVTSIPYATEVVNLRFAPVGSQLLVNGLDGVATVWNIPDGTQALSLSPLANYGDAVFSPDGRQIATTGWESGTGAYTVQIWDAASGAVQQTLTGHVDLVGHVAWVSQNQIVSSDWQGGVKSWTRDGAGNFAESHSWTTAGPPAIVVAEQGLAVSPDGTELVVGTARPNSDYGFEFLSL